MINLIHDDEREYGPFKVGELRRVADKCIERYENDMQLISTVLSSDWFQIVDAFVSKHEFVISRSLKKNGINLMIYAMVASLMENHSISNSYGY